MTTMRYMMSREGEYDIDKAAHVYLEAITSPSTPVDPERAAQFFDVAVNDESRLRDEAYFLKTRLFQLNMMLEMAGFRANSYALDIVQGDYSNAYAHHARQIYELALQFSLDPKEVFDSIEHDATDYSYYPARRPFTGFVDELPGSLTYAQEHGLDPLQVIKTMGRATRVFKSRPGFIGTIKEYGDKYGVERIGFLDGVTDVYDQLTNIEYRLSKRIEKRAGEIANEDLEHTSTAQDYIDEAIDVICKYTQEQVSYEDPPQEVWDAYAFLKRAQERALETETHSESGNTLSTVTAFLLEQFADLYRSRGVEVVFNSEN